LILFQISLNYKAHHSGLDPESHPTMKILVWL